MRLLLLILFLTGCSASNTEPVRNFTFDAPRPFGYVLGDEITQHISFEADDSISLQTNRLPAAGPINRWLNLNQITHQQHASNDGVRHEVTLRYQVFYAPLEVKLLTIPGFNIALQQNSKAINQDVPAWAFNMSPLRELSVRKTAAGEYKRPDAMPLLLQNRFAPYRLIACLISALAIGVYLASLYGLLPHWFKKIIFKPAAQQLGKLSKNEMDKALGLVHQALNTLNQQPLFHSQLSNFYRHHPAYQPLHAQLDWFFNYSNRYFFTQGMIAVAIDLEKLQALCLQAQKIEQGRL
ncbi:MAG: nonribosomal peptide synthetase MxaA [Methylococcaceae bacterium]|nr:nonribosomal peptide synthetase MxaA [Methylococcaceae bacterium]